MAILAAWLHQIDPFAIEILPGIGVRWYGLAYIAGALAGWGIVRWLAGRGRAQIRPELAFDMALTLLVGAFVGGRIGYCLLYEPKLLGLVLHPPYWGVLALQKGGMASHGGFIGMIVAAWWFARRHQVSLLHMLDLACLAGPLGIVFGRIANFINGELYGRPAPADLWWGVKFPQEIFTWRLDELEKLAPSAGALGIKPTTWFSWLIDPSEHQDAISDTLTQIVTAVQKGNGGVIQALEPVLTVRYPSQLIQGILEGLLVFLILAIFGAWPRKPGTIAALFAILYAIARIVGEQFRMPDTEIGFEWFGLTRGQELSALMLIMGIAFFVAMSLRPVAKLPGWFGPPLPVRGQTTVGGSNSSGASG